MGGESGRRAVLIAGPTASGKSALAIERASELDGVVVNADAMQVYSGLRVLTARPDPNDMGGVPHLLYGTVSPAVRFSTGEWLRAVESILEEHPTQAVVFVGGTGLYFDALTRGFAGVPQVPPEFVREAEAELAGLDRAGRARLIAERDPQIASLLRAPDPQRVARALAVKRATGRSLASFQQAGQRGLLEGWAVERIVLDPGRDVVRQRIAERFVRMLDEGAIKEVEALLALDLDPGLPAMKAIGVREIAGFLAGRLAREEMIELAVTATRQYAKRQRTWFRGRMGDWTWLAPPA